VKRPLCHPIAGSKQYLRLYSHVCKLGRPLALLVGAAGVISLAACNSGTQRATRTAPSLSVMATCQAAQLSASVTNNGTGAGSWDLAGSLQNDGDVACKLRGYPRIRMLGTSGQPIATAAKDATWDELAPPGKTSSSSIPSKPPVTTLHPGGKAVFSISASDGAGLSGPTTACPVTASIEIAPPDALPSAKALMASVESTTGGHAAPFTAEPRQGGAPCGSISVSMIANSSVQQ
jgi:Protein of unknown function (DUF4232)